MFEYYKRACFHVNFLVSYSNSLKRKGNISTLKFMFITKHLISQLCTWIKYLFQDNVRDLEELLEQEEQARQKLDLDRMNLDSKFKLMEERLAEVQDTQEKLLKEKKSLEERASLLSKQLMEEEEKSKQITKHKQRVIFLYFIKRCHRPI